MPECSWQYFIKWILRKHKDGVVGFFSIWMICFNVTMVLAVGDMMLDLRTIATEDSMENEIYTSGDHSQDETFWCTS